MDGMRLMSPRLSKVSEIIYFIVIVYIYVADVVLKISSNGIILNKYGYLKSTINMLDFSLTILYIIYINSDRQLLDFSPIRLVTFLIDIGSFVPGK